MEKGKVTAARQSMHLPFTAVESMSRLADLHLKFANAALVQIFCNREACKWFYGNYGRARTTKGMICFADGSMPDPA